MTQQETHSSISRRTFLQGAAFLGVYGGLTSLGLAGCTAPASGGKSGGSWTAGTYSAQVTGHNAPFTIDVTFSDTAITAIDASTNQESLGVGASALQDLASQIIEHQTLNVDSVTGATLSSMCLQQGVKECAGQAGAAKDLEKATGPEDIVKDSYTADVCVIGGGGAGLTAAISAAQAGAKVVVIEKCGITGGSTNVSEGALNAVDPERQQKQGIEDSTEKFYEVTYEGGHGQGTPELIRYLTDNALDSVHWLESIGVEFKPEVGSATGSLGERSHYPATPSGNTYIRSFQKFIEDHPDQLALLNEMQAQELITEGGKVAGVKAVHRGKQPVTVQARSVVIATGGFGANVEYRQRVNTGVWADVKLDDSIGCTNIKPCAQGEGLKLAEAAGAELVGLPDIQLHPCGTPGTGLMEDIRTSGRNRIFVNKNGERFVNEGAERDTLCKAIFAQPDSTYWIVVNKVRYPSETQPDANGATIENMLALGHIVKGETIEDLASKTKMDAVKLQEAIDGYNKTVSGEAEDPFGFKATNTADQQLTEGPWYACRKVPTVHHTMGGVRIDVDTRALAPSGSPVEGLFACGECTGGIHGSNRLGGNAIADCVTFGRTAGTNAAKNALGA
ncbi:flavocytochrome c [Paraeggerthella hongkongensis]|uniref:flavocytochrome c n=1 Tax=Paraeggerthella hominis TaxID=2897351 RepID=UPI001C101AC4|nr:MULTISPECIES: flavocytochrome c [Paraeggerthella]MBU5405758.1 flavocytochrome c [Paraeggerthella hongkongensis]MCD2433605.1 flavocytochrome c [Paraeggerthella hominis]